MIDQGKYDYENWLNIIKFHKNISSVNKCIYILMKHLESCFNLKTVVRHFSDSSVNIYDIFHLRSIIIIFQKVL